MIKKITETFRGADNRPTLLDATWMDNGAAKPIVIFSHGYKGYKDWGAWNLVADAFANAGFIFVKFNFSHNGGTVEQPIDFPDLEAFGQNNYSKELSDLGIVIDWCLNSEVIPDAEKKKEQIFLIGHSRGGGISVLKAAQDTRIKALVTWASVSDYAVRFPKGTAFDKWRETGVYYVKNGRTKQEMPHYFQFYEDFDKNRHQLDIRAAAESLDKPFLIIHGEEDMAVSPDEARALHRWNQQSKLLWIPGTGHTFGSRQPYHEQKMPEALQKVVVETIGFLRK